MTQWSSLCSLLYASGKLELIFLANKLEEGLEIIFILNFHMFLKLSYS